MAVDPVANIIECLHGRGFDPRRVGPDSWEARCPADRSMDHALAISRNEHNHVVLECRSPHKCTYSRIIAALALPNDRVYAETPRSLIDRLRRTPIWTESSGSAMGNEDLAGAASHEGLPGDSPGGPGSTSTAPPPPKPVAPYQHHFRPAL